ncbi:MAG: glycine cleavage system protein GcvH [Clostridiales bacterium]|nr:glycine cleavage system protein GcvH [Clostridiales bacterium]
MSCPKELKYTKSHEWVNILDGMRVQIGITDFAQSQLGDLVYISLPEVGDELTKEESFADVESVKAASDIYSPVTATVSKINEELSDSPENINNNPYGSWLIEATNVIDMEELMSAEAYEEFLKTVED